MSISGSLGLRDCALKTDRATSTVRNHAIGSIGRVSGARSDESTVTGHLRQYQLGAWCFAAQPAAAKPAEQQQRRWGTS